MLRCSQSSTTKLLPLIAHKKWEKNFASRSLLRIFARDKNNTTYDDRQATAGCRDARALYPDSSLADLYDEVTMPPELRRAHQQNDRAVMEAYGFPVSRDFTESDCVARLFEMYKTLTQ